eukprot:GHVN01000068.1.p1 GENE.GHVN01000068.1~~GHVN01000068.1.p1  ORF type:complete len:123 (+),score=11.86 GHVN01000068.1:22-390(+)
MITDCLRELVVTLNTQPIHTDLLGFNTQGLIGLIGSTDLRWDALLINQTTPMSNSNVAVGLSSTPLFQVISYTVKPHMRRFKFTVISDGGGGQCPEGGSSPTLVCWRQLIFVIMSALDSSLL